MGVVDGEDGALLWVVGKVCEQLATFGEFLFAAAPFGQWLI